MFSEISHPDYREITDEQYENRACLQKVMIRNGFKPIDCEWWHFTLEDEPYPDTYFDFPVSSAYLRRQVVRYMRFMSENKSSQAKLYCIEELKADTEKASAF